MCGVHRSARVGAELSAHELEALRRAIEARPHEWVGQEQAAFASSPTLTGARN